MEVKFLDEYLAMKAKMKAQADEMAEGVIIDIKKMFTDKNIKRLGLWHIELTDSQEPNYKEEDKKLFADVVAPGFRGNLLEIQEFLANGGKSADLSFGGEDGYIDGLIFGIEEDGDSIAFVGYDSEHEDVVRIPALDAYNDTENWKISYDDIILSISESICTNINNNIPVDKWDVAHCSNIDPYTWKI